VLCRLLSGSQRGKIANPSANAAGHHELQGLLQDGWQTPQRSSQKTDQHHCLKPQHWRIEKPYLRRVRPSINKLAGHEGWKRFQPVPVPCAILSLLNFSPFGGPGTGQFSTHGRAK